MLHRAAERGMTAKIPGTPESGHWFSVSACPLCAKSGHSEERSHAR